MNEENKDLVTEKVTENVEETTEQTTGTESVEQSDTEKVTEEKLYTEAEFNKKLDEVLAKKIARKEARIKKEYDNKYSKVETVLNAGLGTKTLDEATNKLADFYRQKGVKIPEQPTYSERDLSLLASAEAEDIISAGFDEVVEEVDRLAEKGLDNMTPREKMVFSKLAEKRRVMEDEKALAKLGVSKDILNNNEFKTFAEKLNPSLSLKEKYEMFSQFKPKPKVEQIGSMKSNNAGKVKEYYTAEEISRMTDEDLDDPKVWEAVRRSMTGRA